LLSSLQGRPELGEWWSEAHLGQNVRPYLKKQLKQKKGGDGRCGERKEDENVAQGIEYLSSTPIPSHTHKKNPNKIAPDLKRVS
jgi:hypothetical protein